MMRLRLTKERIDIIRANIDYYENLESNPDIDDDTLRDAVTMRYVLMWALAEIEKRRAKK